MRECTTNPDGILTSSPNMNPNGIRAFSPGLRAARYPGWTNQIHSNPKGVAVANVR